MTRRIEPDRPSLEFDRLMTAWFEEEARVREPDDLLDRTIARTARRRPRPAWLLPERWIPMELTMRRLPLPAPRDTRRWQSCFSCSPRSRSRSSDPSAGLPKPFGPAANGAIVYATSSGDIATVDPVTGVAKTIVGGGR